MRLKPKVKYQSISLTVPFIENIKKHIMFNPSYSSVADFAREAIREKLQRGKSELLEVFFNIYVKESDQELVREMIKHKDFSDLSLEEMKEEFEKVVASVEKLKQKEKKELVIEAKEIQQEKKEPVIQLSKSELTDMIQGVVTEMLDKREKKL